MTEATSPGRMYRFNPIVQGVSRYRASGLAAYIIPRRLVSRIFIGVAFLVRRANVSSPRA